MKEDAQLICPIGFVDKGDVWPIIQQFVCDRLPLKDVTWRSPISSSFVNIDKLPLRFLPAHAKLFNETSHPYRRFLAPYVHMYLLCAESMETYKANKSTIKKWVEQYNNAKIGKQPWIIVYVPLGTSTMDVYAKVNARLSSDFYTEKAGDHSVMLTIPPENNKRTNISAQERASHQALFQQAYASLADLLVKLREGVVSSFQLRTTLYDADIRRLDAQRGTPQFDFWQLFLVKESLALMFQMMQLPDRALSLYDELEVLLPFAPYHSLPLSDWPMVAPILSKGNSTSGNGGIRSSDSPVKQSGSAESATDGTLDQEISAGRGERDGTTSESEEVAGSRTHASEDSTIASTYHTVRTRTAGSDTKVKKDLMTDACRCGEDIIGYSINQARVNIVWNRFSYFQLQHYIFARQMYFLLVHLRQPTRCAEKALNYMRTATSQLEQRLQRQYASAGNPDAENEPAELSIQESSATELGQKLTDGKLLQLRRAQADLWALVASLKLIRECRALLQLLVGGDAHFNSVFYPSTSVNQNNAGNISGGTNCAASYSYASSSSGVGGVSNSLESFQDNLAAIGNASTHGGSVVYSSLAELSRSQHGILHSAGTRTASVGGTAGVESSVSAAGYNNLSTGGVLSPAAALREVLFSPQLDISTEVRDSSRVLGDLIEFALQRLNSLSSSSVKHAGQRAIELTLSREPFSMESYMAEMTLTGARVVTKHTVAKVSSQSATTFELPFNSAESTSEPTATAGTINADVVLSMEQELSLLDECRDNGGMSGVGERMDQILMSISQKVRSTSHFWAKLYELSTLSHILHPALSNGAGTEEVDGEISTPTSPSGSSPFGSRVGTPISSPAPAASTGRSSHGIRKMISRHSSRSLVMSKSKLERGKLLELCLSVLGCSAQWHLQLLANRPRFAISAMLRCADLLMCNQQLVVAAKRLEEALKSGMLAPVTAFIYNADHSRHTPAITPYFGSNKNSSRMSIFRRSLPDLQLHQQLEDLHRTNNFTACLADKPVEDYPMHGAWALLWHWTLRKLLYCLQSTRQWEKYRTVLANLLIPTSVDGINRLELDPPTFLGDILREFISISKSSTLVSCVPEPSGTSTAINTTMTSINSTPFSSLFLPLLRLPLSNYFDFTVGVVQVHDSSAIGEAPKFVRGFEVIREEWLPVSAMQCEGGRSGGYCLPILLKSKLPGAIPVDALQVVYKRFRADSVVSHAMHAREQAERMGTKDASIRALLAVQDDEFVCVPVATSADTTIILEPGAHSFLMTFQPNSLGDYRIDRVMLVVGTAVFEAHLLADVCASNIFGNCGRSTGTESGGEGANMSLLRDDMLSSPAFAGLSMVEELDAAGRAAESGSGARIFSAGESAALTALKRYFQQHSIVQVLAPNNVLSMTATVATTVPMQQTDDAYFSLDTRAGDELTDIQCSAWGVPLFIGSADEHCHSGNLSGSGLAGNSGAAAAALKLAHSKSPLGFVPEDQATPAAMRRRRLDPMDEDEAEAMASAAAAVASLLAQQAAENQRSTQRWGSRDFNSDDKLMLVIAPTADWVIISTSVPTSDDVNSVDAVDASEEKNGQVLVRRAKLGSLSGESRLHFRIPFTINVETSEVCIGGSGGEVVMMVEVTGKLVRGGCSIPVCISQKLCITAMPLMSMKMMVYHTCQTGNSGGLNVLLQAELVNCTTETLELIGYGVVPAPAISKIDGPWVDTSELKKIQSNDCISIIDGPTDLHVFDSTQMIVNDVNCLVPVLPHERYQAGIALRCKQEIFKSVIKFLFHRTRLSMVSRVGACIYFHRYFAVECALVRGLNMNEDLGAPSVQTPLSLDDNCVDGSRCLQITTRAQMQSSSSITIESVIPLAKVFACVYMLTIRFPTGVPGDCSTVALYRQESLVTENKCTNLPVTVANLPQSCVAGLTVRLCETADWMAVGFVKRDLTRAALCLTGSPKERAETPHNCSWVEVSFALPWSLLPVTVGLVDLPPMQVEMLLSPPGVAQGTKHTKYTKLLHPNKLHGQDAVNVCNTTCNRMRSSENSDASHQIILRSQLITTV